MNYRRRQFLKQIGMATAGAGLWSAWPENSFAMPPVVARLPRSKPELQSTSSSGISSFLDAVEKSKIEFHSVMVIRHGHVIAEGWWAPYAAELKHTLYSLSKSFTSTAVGMALNEKHFTLESPVISFFPNELPEEISPNLKSMKVKHLLTMSSGHAKDTIPKMRGVVINWVKEFLSLPVEFEPGTHFVYNTGATYMLSAIIQKKTGKTLSQYLKPRLFDPLGITNPDWELDPRGINTGGFGLRIKTEDIACFGQLYLKKGLWKGKQIIPAGWVADATSTQIDSSPSVVKRPKEEDDWSQGYGYQFWRCRHGAYRGDGAFGQFCIVLPEQDAVVAITGESFDLQASMNLVWDYLLPAMRKSPLPANTLEEKYLREKLTGLKLEPPRLNTASPLAQTISGKDIKLEPNEFNATNISFTLFDDYCLFRLKNDKTEHQVVANVNRWTISENFKTQTLFPLAGRPDVDTPLAASITWKDDNTLIMTLRYIATAHSDTIIFTIVGGKIKISFLNSVSRGNPETVEKRKQLLGYIPEK